MISTDDVYEAQRRAMADYEVAWMEGKRQEQKMETVSIPAGSVNPTHTDILDGLFPPFDDMGEGGCFDSGIVFMFQHQPTIYWGNVNGVVL